MKKRGLAYGEIAAFLEDIYSDFSNHSDEDSVQDPDILSEILDSGDESNDVGILIEESSGEHDVYASNTITIGESLGDETIVDNSDKFLEQIVCETIRYSVEKDNTSDWGIPTFNFIYTSRRMSLRGQADVSHQMQIHFETIHAS